MTVVEKTCPECGSTFSHVRKRGAQPKYCPLCRPLASRERARRRILRFKKQHPGRLEKLKRRWYESHRQISIERGKKHYRQNREKVLKRTKRKMKLRKEEIFNLKGGKCEVCGFDNPLALVLHHINGIEDKSERYILRQDYDLSKIQLLCANCHMIHHLGNSRYVT